MNNQIKELMDTLWQNVSSEDFITIAYDVIDTLEEIPESIEAIEPIIELIEMNPEVDFGNPGPLVHFLEKYNEIDYYEKLIESIKRKPTLHTLFMYNRIVNSLHGSKKDVYIKLYDVVIHSSEVDKDVKKLAERLLAFQLNEKTEKDDDLNGEESLLEHKNIVLVNPVDKQRDLIRIKNELGIEIAMKDLLQGSKSLPFVLVKGIPLGQARRILEKLGELQEKIEIRNT